MNKCIEVNNLTKIFRVYHDKRIKATVVAFFKRVPFYENFKVLQNISFDVFKGECLGIIGHNGSGKSTLLKLLAKIIFPDKGIINIHGTVSTLIELDAGLHPDLTGLENIYLNGTVFGLTRRQITKNLDKVISFSELDKFLDTQVRYYSSGMKARLGFSIAIHVDSDLLLIDEALAVGDVSFREKCYKKILELKKKGISIVYVSHDLSSVELICDRVLWLEKGYVVLQGEPSKTISAYS